MPRLPSHVVVTLRRDVGRMFFSFWCNTLVGSPFVPRLFRSRLLSLAGLDVRRAHIASHVTFFDGNVVMEQGAAVNVDVIFEGLGSITLERNVAIAPGVILGTSTHEMGPPEQRMGKPLTADIVVGAGTWICTRAVILPGVTIGAGCVIAAGAVVTRDCQANGLYAGVPARLVRMIP